MCGRVCVRVSHNTQRGAFFPESLFGDRDRAPHSFPINSHLFPDRYLSRAPRRDYL